MSQESGKFEPFRKLSRARNRPAVIQSLGNACEMAMANQIDLMDVQSEIVELVAKLHIMCMAELQRNVDKPKSNVVPIEGGKKNAG